MEFTLLARLADLTGQLFSHLPSQAGMIGHMCDPAHFRCHDIDHASKDGKTSTQDCANCHNLLARERVLSDLGVQ